MVRRSNRRTRLKDDPQWNVHALDGKHDLMRDAPEELLRIVLEAG
ncbi:hypothetical protein [Amycolatopsis sp. FDAARGOS 1241]|nr:hypothetical protein [Amycolatopsis sp. FDAARGOS 1241]